MKKHLCLLVFLLFSCIAFSQTSFRVRLDSAYFSQGTSILSDRITHCADGGYCVAGPTWDITGGLDVMLIKTDSSGTFEWSKTYGYAFNEIREINLIASSDSGFYLSINEIFNGPNWDA